MLPATTTLAHQLTCRLEDRRFRFQELREEFTEHDVLPYSALSRTESGILCHTIRQHPIPRISTAAELSLSSYSVVIYKSSL